MKISEYIQKLQVLQMELGDVPVLMYTKPIGDLALADSPGIIQRQEGDKAVLV
jgi:hypothetical protein